MMRGLVLLVVLLTLTGCGGSSRPKPVSAKAEGFPGEVVEADGHKVYYECRGAGSPTVVFLNGHPAESSYWGDLFDHVARVTRACEYDRFGLGLTATYGTIRSNPRDALDQVHELEQLLRNGAIPKPYVLVGHSWGGTLAVLYAGTHQDVKGVVLVDASVPGEEAAVRAALPAKRAGESADIAQLRAPPPKPLEDLENLDWTKSLAEAGKVTSLGDTPEIVITAGSNFLGDVRFVEPVWLRLHEHQARLSSDGVFVLAPKSSHFVQHDAPDIVLEATRAVLDAVRNDRHLSRCVAIFGRLADARCLD